MCCECLTERNAVDNELQEILAAAKDVAVRFKKLTGKPL